MVSHTTITGAAGEHYVMSQLLRRGYIAALAPAGVPNTDIVVTDVEGGRLCSIQVKTRREIGRDGGWHMRKKHECLTAERMFYCFVDFGEQPSVPPKAFVVPNHIVAQVLATAHQEWLAIPGRGGKPHNDSDMRRLLPDYSAQWRGDCPYAAGWLNQYKDAWHLLDVARTDPNTPVEVDDEG